MKKQLLTLALLAGITSATWAQAPAKFNYQGIARTSVGAPMASQSLSMRLSVLDGSAAGTAVYIETQSATTNAYGLYNIQIGGGTAVTGTMAAVNWASGDKYLKVEIDPVGGSNYVALGTSQLLSVPYALSAGDGINGGATNMLAKYSSATTITPSQLFDNGTSVAIGATTATAKFHVESSGSGIAGATVNIKQTGAAGIGLNIGTTSTDAAEVISNSGTGGFLKCYNGGASQLIGLRSFSFNGSTGGRMDLYGDGTGTGNGGFLWGSYGYGLVAGDQTAGGTSLASFGGTTYPNAVLPWLSNICPLGNASFKWTAVYATNGTIQTSDERTKQNIKPVSYGLNTIMQLKPVSWTWKDKNAQIGTGTNLGFIAQDVEQILPDVIVHTYSTDAEVAAAKKDKGIDLERDTYGVKYAEFTPVIVKAMQEQQQQIEALNARVKALEDQLNATDKK